MLNFALDNNKLNQLIELSFGCIFALHDSLTHGAHFISMPRTLSGNILPRYIVVNFGIIGSSV